MAGSREVTTSKAFYGLLEVSGLVSEEQIGEAYRISCDESDPKEVARRLVKSGLINRWQARQLLSGRHRLRFGKYRLIDAMGTGNDRRVYLAEHVQMQRRAVLKLLGRQGDASSNALAKFLVEARAIATLDHRNILHIYDFDCQDDRHYVVVEHVEGMSLQSLVERKAPLDFELFVNYVSQIVDGLTHAHSLDIVHGELRPDNLLVDQQGTIKIRNMGVARLAEKTSKKGMQRAAQSDLESEIYLAPEQTNESSNADPRSDIYSLGCICFFLLNGKVPFDVADPKQRRKVRKLCDQRSDIPDEIVDMVAKMMATSPGDRYQGIGEVKAVLKSYVENSRSFNDLPTADRSDRVRANARRNRRKQNAGSEGSTARAGAAPAISVKPQKRNLRGRRPVGRGARKQSNRVLLFMAALGIAVLLAAVTLVVVLTWEDKVVADKKQAATGGVFSSFEPDDSDDPPPIEVTARRTPPAKKASKSSVPPPANPTGAENGSPTPTTGGQTGQPTPDPESEIESEQESDRPPVEVARVDEKNAPPDEFLENLPATTVSEESGASLPEMENAAPVTADPFDGMESDVRLPDLPSEADDADPAPLAMSLGAVHLPTGRSPTVRLVGGDAPANGRVVFTVESPLQKTDDSQWEIRMREGLQANTKQTTVACLSLVDQQLGFSWTEDAIPLDSANYLRNCALTLRAGKFDHAVALRQPITLDPITIKLLKGRMRLKPVRLLWAPDPSELKVEVTQLEGQVPAYTFEPERSFSAKQGKTNVSIGQGDDQLLSFEIIAKMRNARSSLQILVKPYFRIGSRTEVKPLEFTTRNWRTAGTGFFQRLRFANVQLDQITQQIVGNPSDDQKAVLNQQKTIVEENLTRLRTAITQMEQLQKLMEGLHDTAKIHYRVTYKVGEHLLELASSGGELVDPFLEKKETQEKSE